MKKQKVVILGSTGMLGSMLLDVFAKDSEFDIVATYRNDRVGKSLKNKYPGVTFGKLAVQEVSPKDVLQAIKGAKWVVNAIGVIKPYIHDEIAEEIDRAISVNARFPHLLAQAAKNINSKVIQIATDCVYSGQKGHYMETDSHDALDVYGKTKSLGEVFGDQFYHLRCSIIGPELKGHYSLLDWFLGQPRGAEVNGFTNHQWNGITTLHFARICYGIIKNEANLPHVQHIVPGNIISKAKLLKSIAEKFNREDVIIHTMNAPVAINRTLSTNNQKLNKRLWKLAGYDNPPTVAQMLEELAA